MSRIFSEEKQSCKDGYFVKSRIEDTGMTGINGGSIDSVSKASDPLIYSVQKNKKNPQTKVSC